MLEPKFDKHKTAWQRNCKIQHIIGNCHRSTGHGLLKRLFNKNDRVCSRRKVRLTDSDSDHVDLKIIEFINLVD